MSNTTISPPSAGPKVLQAGDFYMTAGVLHPIVIGTIALALLFAYLRMSSNRSVAPMTLFDSIVSVALGSTMAGIINGTALVRGMLALGVLLFWQFITSYIGMRWPGRAGGLLVSPALVIAFHGKMLEEVMHAHRVSEKDLYGALRAAQVWSISEVEVVAIEPTGQFSIYKRADYPKDFEPDVLYDLPAYKALREHEEEHEEERRRRSKHGSKAASGHGKKSQDQTADDCVLDVV